MTSLLQNPLFRYVGLALLAVATLLVVLQSGNSLRYVDESDYAQLAQSIIHEHRFAAAGQPTMTRPPGYPGVIAAIYEVSESPLAAKLANVVFLLLAVLTLGALARRIAPGAEALLPYLVLAYPLVLYATSVLYPQVFGCLMLSIVVLMVCDERLDVGKALLAGLVYGILTLAIPYFLMLLPLFAVFICVRGRNLRTSSLALAASFFVVAMLVIGTWTARNVLTFHHLVPVSANNGINLLIGNSPITGPNSGVGIEVLPLCPAVHDGMTEYDFDAATRRCAIDWITHNPGAALRLYVAKVVNYFNYRNELATASEQARWRDWVSFLTYYPLLALALLRLGLARRMPLTRPEILIYLLYFLNALASAIFFTRLRFRIPFDFLLIGVNAAFLARLWASRMAVSRRVVFAAR